MSDVQTSIELDNKGDVTVKRYQDAQDIADWAKHHRDTQRPGGDFRYRWTLPTVLVERFYAEYAGAALPPMNDEFWQWVDKRKMCDPQFAKFRADDPSNPYFSGYGSKR